MELGDPLQLRQHLGLLRQNEEGHGRGQFLLVTLCFTGIGVIAGAGGNADDLQVLGAVKIYAQIYLQAPAE